MSHGHSHDHGNQHAHSHGHDAAGSPAAHAPHGHDSHGHTAGHGHAAGHGEACDDEPASSNSQRYEMEDLFRNEAPENRHFFKVAGLVLLVLLLGLALVYPFLKYKFQAG